MPRRWVIRRLAAGELLSSVGSWAAGIATSFFMYRRTGSAIWVAGTLFFTFGITGFLSPLAGKVADRYERRRVMIVSDLASAACWGALVWIREPVVVIAFAFLASVVGMPFGFAARAAVPNLVGEDELGWANGLLSAAASIGRLLGPALGGGIFAVAGVGVTFAVNSVSFLLSAALSASIRKVRFSVETPSEEGGSLEGFRVIARDRVLLKLLVAWTISYFAMDIAFVADPPLATSFGVGAFGFGLLDTFFGAGAVIGGLYARRVEEADERRWITLGLLGVAFGWSIIAGAPWFAVVLVASAGAAAFDAVGGVAGYSVIQRRSTDAVRGRVFAAYAMAGMIANTIGFLVVGPLVEAFGPRAVYALGGGLSLAAAGIFMFSRGEPVPVEVPIVE
jgi:MFS family permease